MRFWTSFALAASVAASIGAGAASAQAERLIVIGAAGVTGVYYPAAGAICRLVNRERRAHGVRCSVESTAGSVDNAFAVREGFLDIALAQSDVQADARAGTGAFDGAGADGDLRALFSLHAEPLHVMVRAEAGIGAVADFAGRRVNVGEPGSGVRAVAEHLLRAAGVGVESLARAAEIGSAEQAAALCGGEIDAAIWVAGVPNAAASEAADACAITLLPLDGAWVEALLSEQAAYAAVEIPGGVYRGADAATPSFGPLATVVASVRTPDDVVYAVVRAVFESFEAFRAMHPAFGALDARVMITKGLTAPVHPGAARYYAERGWL
jgi:TRAP transporter TAXI family solute receptor